MHIKERIVIEAKAVISVHGYDAFTMRQLGKAVGLDNSSLYRHFRSKHAIAEAVVDSVCESVLTTVRSNLAGEDEAALKHRIMPIAGYLFDHRADAAILLQWITSTAESGLRVSVSADDLNRPAGQLLQLFGGLLSRQSQTGANDRGLDTIVMVLGAILLRPATRGSLLHSFEHGTLPQQRRRYLGQVQILVDALFSATAENST